MAQRTVRSCDICGKDFGVEEEASNRSIKISLTSTTDKLGEIGKRRALTFNDICLECATGLFALIENYCLKKKNLER